MNYGDQRENVYKEKDRVIQKRYIESKPSVNMARMPISKTDATKQL